MTTSDAKRARNKQWRRTHPEHELCREAKRRARSKGLPFDLKADDIVIPEWCPVLGIRLSIGAGVQHAGSPSLDRFDGSKGYTRDNVRVISYRANTLKSDATPEEVEAVLRYMKTGGAAERAPTDVQA